MPTPEEITHQQNLLATYRRTLAHYLKQQAALGEAYAPPVVSSGISDARSNIVRIKQVLRSWKVPVENYPDDGDDASITPTPIAEPLPPSVAVDRLKLKQVLTEYFNEDELRDLCFELNIDYENLPGTTKAGKARELVAYAERRGIFEKLVKSMQQIRPNVAW